MNGRAQPEIGRRVAELRKLRGLTQAGLAALLHRSESWVTKIERGVRPLDSMAVLIEVAQALAVPVGQLTGEQTAPVDEHPRPGVAALSELKRVLDRPIPASPATTELLPVDEIVTEALELRRVYDTARNNYSAVLPRLPGLLSLTQSVARAAPAQDRSRAFTALVGLYRLAAMEFYRWGDLQRARVAVDRALAAAEQTGDPILVGAVGVFTTQVMWYFDPGGAVEAASMYIELLSRELRASTASGTAVLGALHSFGAKAAARAGDKSGARGLWAAAARTAEAVGRDSAPHGVFFGPMYSMANETLFLVELGDPGKAVRVGETLSLDGLASVVRSGYHATYLAQAHSMRGRDDEALAAIVAGLRAAPELLRDRAVAGGITRDVVRELLHRRRHAGKDLRRVARYLDLRY